jgi:uncharacterized BrkB/YihY/UPF0761 family membrane protein
VIVGGLVIISTVVAGSVGSASHGALAVAGRLLVAFAFNLALFMIAFKLLPALELSWRELVPGVVVATICWQLLQGLGGFYIDHTLNARSRFTACSRWCWGC